jgi:hypothetical protein
MLRLPILTLLVASLMLPAAVCRADDYESALLQKYKKQNQGGSDRLRDEVSQINQQTAAAGAKKAAADSAADAKVRGMDYVIVRTPQGTVRVPDGGVRVQGSFSFVPEGRNEAGVPGLGKMPYLDRGYRNVGTGRSVFHIQRSYSVRIIRMEEEEAKLYGK